MEDVVHLALGDVENMRVAFGHIPAWSEECHDGSILGILTNVPIHPPASKDEEAHGA